MVLRQARESIMHKCKQGHLVVSLEGPGASRALVSFAGVLYCPTPSTVRCLAIATSQGRPLRRRAAVVRSRPRGATDSEAPALIIGSPLRRRLPTASGHSRGTHRDSLCWQVMVVVCAGFTRRGKITGMNWVGWAETRCQCWATVPAAALQTPFIVIDCQRSAIFDL
jgi:hypothetical protein